MNGILNVSVKFFIKKGNKMRDVKRRVSFIFVAIWFQKQ